MSKPDYAYVAIIAASADRVWEGLTSPEFTEQYWHRTRIRSSFEVGAAVEFMQGGEVACCGEILHAEPPHELSYTWLFPRNPETRDEVPSRVTFRLKPVAKGTELTVLHDRFEPGSKTLEMVAEGWPYVIAGLKTLLETGAAVDFTADEDQERESATETD